MKKYSKKIRKSYFPNLFYKQHLRSVGQGKIHVFVHIKCAPYNNRFLKNCSYQNEKIHETSRHSLKSKAFGLKTIISANAKSILLNYISGKTEPQTLYRFTSSGLLFHDLRYPEATTSGLKLCDFIPIRLINRELVACNLKSSNLRFLILDLFEAGYFNYSSANSTLPNFNIRRLVFLKNMGIAFVSKMRSRIQSLQDDENSFLRGSNLFFIQPKLSFRLPITREISSQGAGFFTDSSAYPLRPLLTTSNFFRKVYNETLRKSEELRRLDRNILGRAVLTISSIRRIKHFTKIKSPISSEILFAPLNVPFNAKSLEQKLYAGKKNIKTNHRKQYPSVNQLKKEICEKQQIIATKEIQSLIERKEKQHKLSKAIFCNYKKNKFKKAGFIAKSLANPLISVLVESDFPRKIENELLRKIEQFQFTDQDFLFRVDALVKRYCTQNAGFKTSDELQEPLSRHFNLYDLKRKIGFNKEAVKSLSRKKHSDVERSNLRIRKKQDLIERIVEQEHRELLAFRKVRNMNLLPSVQSLIQNFREKTAFLLDYESLTEPGNPVIDQNLKYQQRKVVFPYSDKKIRKILSISRRLSAKKTIIGKYIPGNLVKDLLIFQREFLNKDTSSFPVYNIQQLTSKQITLIKNRLLDLCFRSNFFPKGSLSSTTLEPQRSTGYKNSERRFFSGFPYFLRQYHEIVYESRLGSYEKMFAPSIVETNKNLRLVLKLSLYENQRSNRLNSSESADIHIFNLLTALTHNKSTGFQLDGQRLQSDRFKITQGDRAAFPLGWQETPKPENSFFTQNSYLKTKLASRKSSFGFKVQRSLLARNKLGHTTGTFGIYGINTTGSPANPIQKKKSYSLYAWIQKPFKLPEVLLPSRITATGSENPAYPQKIPLSQEKRNIATYTLEQSLIQLLSLTRARIFKNPVVLKSSLIKRYILNSSTLHKTGVIDIYLYLQQAFQAFSYAETRTFSEMNKHPEDRKVSSKGISATNSPRTTNYYKDNYLLFDSHKIAHYSTNNQKMEHKTEKKREQRYSGSTTQIDKLQNRSIWPVFLKDLDTIVYRFRKLETLLSPSKRNIAFGGTKIPVFGLREVDINSWQNNIIQNTSVYTETYPFTWTLNSLTTSKQSYPAFFTYYSTSPKKDILEYLRILYSTSGMKTSAATEYLSILSKISNPIPRGNLSSKIFLSGIPSTSASITLLLRSFGMAAGKNPITVYNLLKYTSSSKYTPSLRHTSYIISQYSQLTKKFKVLSNIEIGNSSAESLRYRPVSRHKLTSKHKSVFLLQLYKKQKPYRQKVSHWKTAMVNLSSEGRKKKAANTGNFLQKTLANSLKRENNNLQVNKKSIDTFTEAQMKQSIFSDLIISSKYDFTKRVKWKKISSTTFKLGKTPKNMQDIFNGSLFKSKIPRDSKKTTEFSRHPGAESTDFVFSKVDKVGKVTGIAAFVICGKKRSELTYSRSNNQKTERENFVYGTSEPLLNEVKEIRKVIFETRAIVADHLESHMPQVTGKPEQVMDIEDMIEKIMQSINRRLKMEAERRGIF